MLEAERVGVPEGFCLFAGSLADQIEGHAAFGRFVVDG